ncbi:hypothetical protein FGRMN_3957 [Fusarium graminum]|nr:hypothetical protein FGRMN_3957 [Fusarium graminum]
MLWIDDPSTRQHSELSVPEPACARRRNIYFIAKILICIHHGAKEPSEEAWRKLDDGNIRAKSDDGWAREPLAMDAGMGISIINSCHLTVSLNRLAYLRWSPPRPIVSTNRQQLLGTKLATGPQAMYLSYFCCNREWPCNGCQKRKVADKCRFKDTNQPVTEKVALDRLKRSRINNKTSPESAESEFGDAGTDGIDALGYMPSHLLFDLTSDCETTSQEFVRDPRSFAQLERALQVIPSRPYTDMLVQNFLNNVNYHYYIIYPPSFLEQYQHWWTARAENRPLSVQWTCLLLTICACASQYTDVELQSKLEVALSDNIQRITEKFHETARELGSAVPLGYSHIINVQQLLHSCYWFKSEARFVECWHVLNAAVREAQELSIHQEAKTGPISEFDLEMRRRVWCILDTWDWQISTLLEAELKIRSDGINYCLELMVSLRGFFDYAYPRDAKFHFVLFCIFDISTVLCSAVLHDEHHMLPRRDEVYKTIDEAHGMLQSLRTVTKSAKASYGILTRIVQRLPRTIITHNVAGMSPVTQRSHIPEVVASPQTVSPGSIHQQNSPPATSFSPSPVAIPTPGVPSPIYSLAGVTTMAGDFAASAAYAAPPACADWQPQLYMQDPTVFAPIDIPPQEAVFANISDEELGELASLWNYQSLDFNFMNV